MRRGDTWGLSPSFCSGFRSYPQNTPPCTLRSLSDLVNHKSWIATEHNALDNSNDCRFVISVSDLCRTSNLSTFENIQYSSFFFNDVQ